MGVYDIGEAFAAIEKELLDSMMRNMERHRAEEDDLGIEWSQWQVEQLKYLEKYKKDNAKRYQGKFRSINKQIDAVIREARDTGNMEQEIEILEAIKNGFTGYHKATETMAAQFFKLNDRKLEALIKAVTDDMEKAETAILRMANDQYRQIIYNAQMYANTGAGTYEKAVDMATKDMLSSGLSCVEYSNGARHRLKDYADMAIRTASKRAYLTGEGEKRQEWGISTVIMNKRGNPCPKCLPWVGKILIDDVWSGGKKGDGPYPLMSVAVAAGLYHPRCRDSHTTYFDGISTPPDSRFTRGEIEEIEQTLQKEAKEQYAERQAERCTRLAKYSLAQENKKVYEKRAKEWNSIAKSTETDIIKKDNAKDVIEVHQIGKIDKNIYKCITEDIVSDEVIITDSQIKHIQERHPDSFEKSIDNLMYVLSEPDYIIEDKHENTGLVVKRLKEEDGHTQIVLRVCTSEDEEGHKNSIISSWKISDKRLQNYLRNRRILYKKE